jgi:two-component system cell cycle response regulator DivK
MSPAIPLPRVLIADGDEDTRDLYEAFLVQRRYSVEQAANGREALMQATNNPPDIIVTEILLRGIDGYCLCELLRADGGTRTVPIVVLTADARPASLERARKSGADVAITKPCLPEILLREMEHVRQKSTLACGGSVDVPRRTGTRPGEQDHR